MISENIQEPEKKVQEPERVIPNEKLIHYIKKFIEYDTHIKKLLSELKENRESKSKYEIKFLYELDSINEQVVNLQDGKLKKT